MPGEPDPRYIIARRTLLDVLEALEVQRRAVIPLGVGCQMVVRAAGGSGNLLVDAETVAASCAILATELLASTGS